MKSSIAFLSLALALAVSSSVWADVYLDVSNRDRSDAVTVAVRRADSRDGTWRELGRVRGHEHSEFTLQRAGTYYIRITDFNGNRLPPFDSILLEDGQSVHIRSNGEVRTSEEQPDQQ